MVGHTEYMVGTKHLESAGSHTGKSLRRCNLVTVKAVNVKLCGTILDSLHDVLVPDLIK